MSEARCLARLSAALVLASASAAYSQTITVTPAEPTVVVGQTARQPSHPPRTRFRSPPSAWPTPKYREASSRHRSLPTVRNAATPMSCHQSR